MVVSLRKFRVPDGSHTGRGSNLSNFWLRTVSALVLIPIVLALVWLGGTWFACLAAATGLLVLREWVTITGAPQMSFAIGGLGIILAACAIVLGYPGLGILAILAAAAVTAVWRLTQKTGGIWGPLGILYAGLPVVALILLRLGLPFGLEAVIFVLVIVWAADSLAYVAGRSIGGPKLWPAVSPKKTWAGFFGGVVGAVVAGFLLAMYAWQIKPVPVALLAGLLAVVAQGGDLLESAIKRQFGVKDSGTLIPGHGGMMDRVDALVAVAFAACIIGVTRGGFFGAPSGLLIW